jgi:hypothetical protein
LGRLPCPAKHAEEMHRRAIQTADIEQRLRAVEEAQQGK